MSSARTGETIAPSESGHFRPFLGQAGNNMQIRPGKLRANFHESTKVQAARAEWSMSTLPGFD
jgi:hypothetical protein